MSLFYKTRTVSDEEDTRTFTDPKPVNIGISITIFVLLILAGLAFGIPTFSRYQKRAHAKNEVTINDIKIAQTKQLVEVEKQKAQVRIQEAYGIARSQEIINATLTDKYLQHEAITAQEAMANSPNHTTIYIPSGQNGIPIVNTIDPQAAK